MKSFLLIAIELVSVGLFAEQYSAMGHILDVPTPEGYIVAPEKMRLAFDRGREIAGGNNNRRLVLFVREKSIDSTGLLGDMLSLSLTPDAEKTYTKGDFEALKVKMIANSKGAAARMPATVEFKWIKDCGGWVMSLLRMPIKATYQSAPVLGCNVSGSVLVNNHVYYYSSQSVPTSDKAMDDLVCGLNDWLRRLSSSAMSGDDVMVATNLQNEVEALDANGNVKSILGFVFGSKSDKLIDGGTLPKAFRRFEFYDLEYGSETHELQQIKLYSRTIKMGVERSVREELDRWDEEEDLVAAILSRKYGAVLTLFGKHKGKDFLYWGLDHADERWLEGDVRDTAFELIRVWSPSLGEIRFELTVTRQDLKRENRRIKKEVKQQTNSVTGTRPTFAMLMERSPRPSQAELIRTLEAGADPNEHIPFPQAEFEQYKKIITTMATSEGESLIAPITRENFFNTPLTLAATLKSNLFFNELMKRGADPNIQLHPYATPPLQIAIGAQNLEMVQSLLDHGADPEQKSYIGNAVSAAVVSWKSKNEMILMELSRQMDVNNKEPLIFALERAANKSFADQPNTVDERSFKILKMLLDRKARVDIKNQNGLDPIMSALIAHNYTAFLMLLPYYEDLDSLTYELDGMKIPLSFLVARSDKLVLMKAVLSRGINTSMCLSNGEKLIDWANTAEMKKLIKDYILEHPSDSAVASVVKRVYQESKLDGWIKVVSEGNIEFKIPPTMEVQGGLYRSFADKFNEKILKTPRDVKEVVVQQLGLNTNSVSAKTHYVRIMYKCAKGQIGDAWKLDEKLILSKEEIQELEDSLRQGVEEGFLYGQKQTSVKQRLLRWDPVEVVPFGNGTAIKMSYCRQLADNPPVELVQYQVGDDDRMHYITFSYRQSEKDMWFPDWTTIMKTFKFLR